jgi:preprotein translocase subunit SecG
MGIAVITVIHVVVCLFLIAVVLLQHGKSADIAATFGGQSSQTAFGPRGAATLLSKATTWSAVIFMLTSISLSILVAKKGGTGGDSVMKDVKPAQTQTKPAQPSPTPSPAPQPK